MISLVKALLSTVEKKPPKDFSYVLVKTLGQEGCQGIHMSWAGLFLNQSRTYLFIFKMIKKYLAAFLRGL